MSMNQSTSPVIAGAAVTQTSALLQKVLAIIFGIFIIGAVGFSHIDVVHNAAHDMRHSNAFPCH
jgi:cobalt transporter subunit CbtB